MSTKSFAGWQPSDGCPVCGGKLRQVGSKAPNTCWACDHCAKQADTRKPNYAREGFPFRLIDSLLHKTSSIHGRSLLMRVRMYLETQRPERPVRREK
jgi:hypothetical protein